MNTYLIPVNNSEEIYIDYVKARSIEDAEQRIMDNYLDEDDDVPADWNDFIIYMDNKYDYMFGDFYELSEFE